MSLQRTPTKVLESPKDSQTCYYGSDSALNLMSKQDLDDMDNCSQITKRIKRKLDDFPHSAMSELKSMFRSFSTQQDSKLDSINQAISTLLDQNSEIQKTVEFMSKRYDDMIERMDYLEDENKTCKKQIKDLENKIEMLEKNSRSTSIEVRNVPKRDRESKDSLACVIRDIGTALKIQPGLQKNEIRDIYRTKSSSIIVDFTTTTTKDMFISKSRIFNKTMKDSNKPQLNTSHINTQGPAHTIYISDFLTAKTKHIFFLARNLVKQKKIATCWTSYSKVYIREAEGHPPMRVDSEEDLHKYRL